MIGIYLLWQQVKPLIRRDHGSVGASLGLTSIDSSGCGMELGCWAGVSAHSCCCLGTKGYWEEHNPALHSDFPPFSPPFFGLLLVSTPSSHIGKANLQLPTCPVLLRIEVAPG